MSRKIYVLRTARKDRQPATGTPANTAIRLDIARETRHFMDIHTSVQARPAEVLNGRGPRAADWIASSNDNPRYFVFWTADGYKTGCYNLECPGFVPVDKDFAIGAAVSNVSTMNGQQYHIPTTIWKDPRTGNWWLTMNNKFVGYWPSILFNHLKDSADQIQWGGEIINFRDGSQHTTTNMGSGRFANEGYQKAAYFRNLVVIDEHDDVKKNPKEGYSYVTQESCYNIRSAYEAQWGVYFFYGGPGRGYNCN